MLFNSTTFILGFLPIGLAGLFLCGRLAALHCGRLPAFLCGNSPDGRWALAWLVGASLVFYGWWNPVHVPLLCGSIVVNYWLGRRIASYPGVIARRWLALGIVLNLSLLGWFKYAGFLFGIDAPALPLAISFFTFQQIMYLADSNGIANNGTASDRTASDRTASDRTASDRTASDGAASNGAASNGRGAGHDGFLPYAAFVSFFPHLIAGPIVRPREILPQLRAVRLARPDPDAIAAGLEIFLLGLAKKLVLADMFGRFADTGFDAAAHGAALTLFEAWYALLAYALQIYFDFSGYSDMAIGLARMMNVRFPVNFASPYQARSIAEFWRRWHITLGLFLRDYVYIPLGGNRRLSPLLITMLLCGLWHGAAWRFVIWGGLHGLFLLVHRLWRRLGIALPPPLCWLLTVLAVVLAWVPFRADGLDAAWQMLRGLGGANGLALPHMIVDALPWLGRVAVPVPLLPYLGDARTLSFPEVTACLGLGWFIVLAMPHVHELQPRMRGVTLTAGFAFTIQALFFAPHVAPFLYFQF
jgi:alginate O-acetyltransferase complex protein AlgI